MKTFLSRLLAALAIAFALAHAIDTAQAQLPPRTWVSSTGSDNAACSRTAPCQTFNGALTKTAVNGEIDCVDPGDYGFVSINQSITIDCSAVPGTVLDHYLGFQINFDLFVNSDVRKTVNIRGITFQGAGYGQFGIGIYGEGTNTHVYIQDVTINGNLSNSGLANGIIDGRTNGNLTVLNTTIRNMGLSGISINPNNGTGIIRATLDRVTVGNAGAGLATSAGAATMISNSVFTENAVVGVQVGPGAQALIENSKIAHNGTGLSAAGTIRLYDSAIFLNANAAVSGTVQTYSNNRFVGAIGGTIVPIGTTTNPSGLQ